MSVEGHFNESKSHAVTTVTTYYCKSKMFSVMFGRHVSFFVFFVDLFSEPKGEIEQKGREPPVKEKPSPKASTSQTVSILTRKQKPILMDDDDDVTSISDGRPKEEKKKPNLKSGSKRFRLPELLQPRS